MTHLSNRYCYWEDYLPERVCEFLRLLYEKRLIIDFYCNHPDQFPKVPISKLSSCTRGSACVIGRRVPSDSL